MTRHLLPSQTNTKEMHDAIKLSAEHCFKDDDRIDFISVFFEPDQGWYIRVVLKDEFYQYADDPERTFAAYDCEQSEFDLEHDIPGFLFEEMR